MSIKTLLREEIQRDMETLKDMEVGSDAYKAAEDGTVKLIDRYIELDKLDFEAQDKTESRQVETYLKKEQMKQDKKLTIFRLIIDIAGIAVPIIVTVWGTKKSFEFEKEGTITTIMGKGFVSNLGRLFKR